MRHLIRAFPLFVICLGLLFATSMHADGDRKINPAVFILDEASGKEHRLFDRSNWDNASSQASKEVLGTVFYADPDALEKANATAIAAGEAVNIVLLSTVNTRDKTSRAFQKTVKQMEELLAQSGADAWSTKMTVPMCRLYQQKPKAGDTIPVAILMVINDAPARLTCYRMVMSYFAGQPDDSGALVEPVYMDSHAVVTQSMMPPIKVHSAYLALKDQRDEKGRYQKRESNVYAPNEEIFLRAYLDFVGRKLPGTMHGSYQIDLSLEVQDRAGVVLGQNDLHSYTGKSTLIYPMGKTYFWNNITAGISLPDTGEYTLIFKFKDMGRDGTPVAEVPFDVVIR